MEILKKKENELAIIEKKVAEYDKLREEEKAIKSRQAVLSKEIKEYASNHGVKDDKGNFYLENEEYVFGSMAKTTIKFDQEKALNYFKEHKMKSAIKVEERVDEKGVEQLINDGKLTMDDLEDLTISSVAYSISVKKKEEMPEVEELEVAASAKKKSTLFKRKK